MGDRRFTLDQGSRFGLLFAVEKAAEMLRDDDGGDGARITCLHVEDEDGGRFDDVVEQRVTADGRAEAVGWQIKRLTDGLEGRIVRDLLSDLATRPALTFGVLGVARFVSVPGVGKLKELAALCERVSRPGVNVARLLGRPRKGDRSWLSMAEAVTGNALAGLALLARFDVRELGFEEDQKGRIDRHLADAYTRVPHGLRAELETWLRAQPGTVDITASLVEEQVLRPFEQRQPGLITRARRASARTEFLEAELRSTAHLRPLDAIAACLPIDLDLTIDGVRVEPITSPTPDGAGGTVGIPLELARARPRFAIIGDVGSGKSIALRDLQARLANAALADPSAPVPVLVHARDLDGPWLAAVAARTGLAEDRVAAVLERPWLLLVDAVDEVGPRAWDTIEQIAAARRACVGAIAASRPVTPPPGARSYVRVHLQPWTLTQVRAFLDKWERVSSAAAQRVRSGLLTGALPQSLLTTPLTATLCVVVAAGPSDLPRNRAALLARISSLLFDEWRRARATADRRLTWAALAAALGRLALEYLRGGGRPLAEADVWRALRRAAGLDGEAIQREAIRHLALLVPRAGGTYDFTFRALTEYLAAEELKGWSEAQLGAHASDAWAMEPIRLALSLQAELGHPERAIQWIREAADTAAASLPALESAFLRRLLIAIRVASDVPDVIDSGTGRRLARAVYHLVVDETSSWVGDVVAHEARRLAPGAWAAPSHASGATSRASDNGDAGDHEGPAGTIGPQSATGPTAYWATLLALLRPIARRFGEEPPAWYAAQRESSTDFWLGTLYHHDAGVRAIAVERLSAHLDDEQVRSTLLDQVLDEGFVLGGVPPAVLAGTALRRIARGPGFGQVSDGLRRVLRYGGQVTATAAAVALRPGEADAAELVAALRVGAGGFGVPPAVIAALSSAPGGTDALDAGWPDWRTRLAALGADARLPRPSTTPSSPPTPSHTVRVRIVTLCTFALPSLSDEDLALFTSRTQYSRDHALVDALGNHPQLADRLDVLHLPLDTQLKVGEAALELPRLRERLLAGWTGVSTPAEYPGLALEPLIELGDEEAAAIYATWLPSSAYMWIMPSSGRRPRPGVLRHPRVLPAARHLALQLLEHATVGRADGTRVSKAVTGDVLNNLHEAWRDAPEVFDGLRAWLQSDDDRAFSGALWALWGTPLPSDMIATTEDGLRRRLASLPGDDHALDRRADAPSWLRWIDDMGLTADLRDAISPLVSPTTSLGCVAGAVLLPLLSVAEARALSARAAPLAVVLDERSLRSHLLQRYVEAAEDQWTTAAIDAIEQGSPFDGMSGLRLLDFLNADNRTRVAHALLHSPAATTELRWIARDDDSLACVRPADVIRRFAYELGL